MKVGFPASLAKPASGFNARFGLQCPLRASMPASASQLPFQSPLRLPSFPFKARFGYPEKEMDEN